MSTAAHLQPNTDFLKGEPHRKHPGVTNLKTLRLPEKLQVAAHSIIHSKCCSVQFSSVLYTQTHLNRSSVGAQVTRLNEKAQTLTNFLWSRKRAVDDVALRQKAMSLEKELWLKATEKREGKWRNS